MCSKTEWRQETGEQRFTSEQQACLIESGLPFTLVSLIRRCLATHVCLGMCVCLCTAISTKQHSTNGFATCWLREELEEASERYMISIKSEQRTLPGLLEILFTVSTMKSKCRVCKSKDTSNSSRSPRSRLSHSSPPRDKTKQAPKQQQKDSKGRQKVKEWEWKKKGSGR